MASPFTLFEVSWEICNKVGGIHTVVSSKARSLVDRFGDEYVAVGPWLLAESGREVPFDEDASFSGFAESCRRMGVPVRVGRWRIPGRPRTILVEFSQLYDQKDDVLSKLWEDYGVDSIAGEWDYVEPVLFGHAAGRVIEAWYDEYVAPQRRRAVAHAHEWMTGAALLHLQRDPAIGTVFTTHATMLGRALSSTGRSPDDGLGDQTAAELARAHVVVAKHSLEGTCARQADAFTTVSTITAREAELLHERAPAPVTPNGIDLEVIDELIGDVSREEVRAALHGVASRLLGEDVRDAAFLAISGRYEFANKGMDVLLDALARVNAGEGRRIVLFVLVPAGNSGVKSAFHEREDLPLEEIDGALGISTHNLFDEERDPVHEHCAKVGLENAPDARVKIVFLPIYLSPTDGFLNLTYEAVLSGMDLSCFPSYYEPWGYTPQESLAVGVPTITTDYAGFGRWASDLGLGPEQGITVLPRVHVQYDEVVAGLAAEIERALADGPSASELRPACRETAARTAWSGFLSNYEEAYAHALAAVQERLKSGVPAPRRAPRALPVRPQPEGQRPRLLTLDVAATLPPELQGLQRLAHNYWWSWDPEGRTLFEELSALSWEATHKNPILFLQRVYPQDLERKARDADYVAKLERVLFRFDEYMSEPAGEEDESWPSKARPVAYFCAEFGVHESLRIYSGGLGALAGDHLKSASDMDVPLVAVGLFYRMGYFGQRLGPDGEQLEVDEVNDPRTLPVERVLDGEGRPLELVLNLPARELRLRAFRVHVGRVTLYLLDSDVPSNRSEDRDITKQLYGGDHETRLRQEIVLGRGGVRLLRELGIEPSVFHMNEGHAAFLTLERVGVLTTKEGLTFDEARELVRSTTLFTTHTPVPAGHDRFDQDLMRRYFSDVSDWVGVPWERFYALGQVESGGEDFNMSYLAMGFASFCNGVSQLHGVASRKLLHPFWPGLLEGEVPVSVVTNGVHLPTWTHPDVAAVLGAERRPVCGEDFDEPLPDEKLAELWRVKGERKAHLLEKVRVHVKRGFLERGDSPLLLSRTLDGLTEDALYVGFARRFAPYKRAELLFHDPERLRAILGRADRPVRILVAGKAHPRDEHGRDLMRRIVAWTRDEDFAGKVVFLENYDLEVARDLVQGVDVWLNTPTRMLEASGTSGMKAAANGTLHLSIGDGWWPEAYDGENGFLIGGGRAYAEQALQDEADASVLYRLLEEEIVPLFFDRGEGGLPHGWLSRMRRCLATIPATFDTDRMVGEYAERAYLPLAEAHAELDRDHRWKLKARVGETHRIKKGFRDVRIVSAHMGTFDELKVGDPIVVRLEVDLAGLTPEDVQVELVLGHATADLDLKNLRTVPLAHVQTLEDSTHAFEGHHEMVHSGSFSYGIRVSARARDGDQDALRGLVLWA